MQQATEGKVLLKVIREMFSRILSVTLLREAPRMALSYHITLCAHFIYSHMHAKHRLAIVYFDAIANSAQTTKQSTALGR